MGAAAVEANVGFNVAIAYEDFETGKYAKKTYDFLIANLDQDCQVNNQMWKFEVLGIPKLREMAAKDASNADIIIVSSRGGDDLPPAVKSWIELWLAQKTSAMALVALFDCPLSLAFQTRPIRAYLADVARRGVMEFFAQPDDWPGKKKDTGLFALESGLHQSPKTLSSLAGAIQQDLSFPHWGINE